MIPTLLRTLILTTLLAAPATAQLAPGIVGYAVKGTISAIGERTTFDCNVRQMATTPGSTIGHHVIAPLGNVYVIVYSTTSASSCLTFPMIHNNVILDPPWITLHFGVINQGVAPNTYAAPTTTLPPALGPGFTFWSQAVAEVPLPSGGQGFAASVAIETAIQ